MTSLYQLFDEIIGIVDVMEFSVIYLKHFEV